MTIYKATPEEKQIALEYLNNKYGSDFNVWGIYPINDEGEWKSRYFSVVFDNAAADCEARNQDSLFSWMQMKVVQVDRDSNEFQRFLSMTVPTATGKTVFGIESNL